MTIGGRIARAGRSEIAIRSLPGVERAASANGCSGGSGPPGSPPPAVTASRNSAESATVRVTHPEAERLFQWS